MGIFQPGGPGTQINVYDDNDATGGHAAGSPHTWAEINAAFPLDFAILQTAAAATFSANRKQYLCVSDLHFGDPGGGSNFTSLVDTNTDIYSPNGATAQTRLRFTVATSANNTSFQLGTKIGTGQKSAGKDGCAIYTGTFALRLRCTLGLYGCLVDCQGALQFNNAGSTQQEIAGSAIEAGGSMILGDADSGPLNIYNSAISYTGIGTAVVGMFIADSFNAILSATAPAFFFSTGAAGAKKLNRLILNGAVTTADLRLVSAAGGWQAADLTYSDTPGKPRVLFVGAHNVSQGLTDYRTFNTKVVDPLGNSIQAVPVYITSDIDGPILDTQTGADGDVVFTWTPTGQVNVLPVREYYDPTGSATVARDRLYTAIVNGYPSLVYPPLPGFATVKFVFEWPGRDRLGTGYQVDGGSFQKALDIIQLPYGTPSTQPIWTPCQVIS